MGQSAYATFGWGVEIQDYASSKVIEQLEDECPDEFRLERTGYDYDGPVLVLVKHTVRETCWGPERVDCPTIPTGAERQRLLAFVQGIAGSKASQPGWHIAARYG